MDARLPIGGLVVATGDRLSAAIGTAWLRLLLPKEFQSEIECNDSLSSSTSTENVLGSCKKSQLFISLISHTGTINQNRRLIIPQTFSFDNVQYCLLVKLALSHTFKLVSLT